MTQGALQFHADDTLLLPAISPRLEMGAYVALWARFNMSLKKLAQLFRDPPGALSSELIKPGESARHDAGYGRARAPRGGPNEARARTKSERRAVTRKTK